MSPRRILIATIGSAGDVHPKIGLGLALQRRGHRVTLVTGSRFAPLCEAEGLPFEPIAPGSDFDRTAEDPRVWHPTRGFEVLARGAIVPALRPLFDRIRRERERHPDLVVLASSLCLGARLAQEALGAALATVHMQPVVLRSRVDPVGTPHPSFPRRGPRWAKDLAYWLADRWIIDRELAPPLNALRRELGLAPVRRLFDGWVHSPQLVLGLWPVDYGPPLPDWPPCVELCGFPLYDPPSLERHLDPRVEAFLHEGQAPVLVTAGSGHLHAGEFLARAERAAHRVGARALFVSPVPYAPQRPGMLGTSYLPFARVVPRCAAVVHHGGVGTTARALAAGIPQLVLPLSFDQPDNALRVQAAGRGTALLGARNDRRVARALRAELETGPRSAWNEAEHGRGIPRAVEALESWMAALPAH